MSSSFAHWARALQTLVQQGTVDLGDLGDLGGLIGDDTMLARVMSATRTPVPEQARWSPAIDKA